MLINQYENTNGPWDIYKAVLYSQNGVVSTLFECGLDGIDLRFLEYSLGYLNIPPNENPQSLVNLIPISEMDSLLGIDSSLPSDERSSIRQKYYKFLSNIIIPTQYIDSIAGFNENGNGIKCFGSYSFGAQITYVISAPGSYREGEQGISKIELFNIDNIKLFDILFGQGLMTEENLLEFQYDKVVFLSLNQTDGEQYSNKVSYHAWTKLVNPVRRFNESTLVQKDFIDPPQFSKDSRTGIWFDEASGSTLGNLTENSADLPILKKKRDKYFSVTESGLLNYSPWKEYSNNEKVIWKGETYRSLGNHNLNHTPGVSKWWARECELVGSYTRRLIPRFKSNYLIGKQSDTGTIEPEFYNIMPWTKKVRFEARPSYEKGYNIILDTSSIQEENVKYELRRPYEDSNLYYVDLDLSNLDFTEDTEYLNIWIRERFRDRKFMSPELNENLELLGYKKINNDGQTESEKRCGNYRILDVIEDNVKISVPLILGATNKIDNLDQLLKSQYNIKYIPRSLEFNGTSEDEFYKDIHSDSIIGGSLFTDYNIICEEVNSGYNYNMEFYIPYYSGELVDQEYVSGLYFDEINEFFVAMSNSGDLMIDNLYQVVEKGGTAEIRFKLYSGISDLEPETQSNDNIVSIPISSYVWVVNKPDGTRNVDENGNRIMADPEGAEQNITLKYNKTEREYTLKIEDIRQNYTIDIVL